MSKHVLNASLTAVLAIHCIGAVVAGETPYGKGMTEANKERLVLDDMQDVSDWDNGSPVETKISASDKHVRQGGFALKFANVIDHTSGEKNYPIGWPRTGKDLARAKMSDWSGYDFFECWVYADTSRESLPGTPLNVGFYQPGHRQNIHVRLKEVRKGQWTKIVIPITKLTDPKDVQRVQFNISESDYKHGDRVDFYVCEMALTRFVEPAIAGLAVDRRILYSNDKQIAAVYALVGYKGIADVKVEFEIGPKTGKPAAKVSGAVDGRGVLPLPIAARLTPGTYAARLSLRDAQGKLIDQGRVEFRVIEGPF